MSNSPDITPYVDLRIYDKDVQDIFDATKMHVESRLPDVTLREDHTETVLLEAISMAIAENAMAINRLPEAVMTVLLKMYGSTFYEGKEATVTIGLTFVSGMPEDIPVGTRFAVPVNEEEYVTVVTTSGVVVSGSTRYVNAVALLKTSVINTVPLNTPVEALAQIAGLEGSYLRSIETIGEDAEDSVTWINRSVQRLTRLTDTLVTAQHFQTAALEESGVYRAKAIDNYNGATNTAGVAGNITIAVYGTTGVLTPTRREEIRLSLQSRAMANLTIHVVNPVVTSVNYTATVVMEVGYTAAQVQANIATALNTRFTPTTWDWRTTITRNEIIATIGSTDGVAYVQTLAAPAADITLSGAAVLPSVGTVTITAVTQ